MSCNSALVPFNLPLNELQERLLAKAPCESSVSQGLRYIAETDGIARKILSPSKAFGLSLTLSEEVQIPLCASTTGYGVGIACSIVANSAAPSAASGLIVLAGGLAGGILGLAVFEGAVICINLCRIFNDPAYTAWKERRAQILSDKAVEAFLAQDTILSLFLCPITGALPLIPAHTGHGITFDYHAAAALLDDGKLLPGINIPLSVADLRFDYAHVNSIIERLDSVQTLVDANVESALHNMLTEFAIRADVAKLWKSVMQLVILHGYLTPEEAFLGSHAVTFGSRIISRAGKDLTSSNFVRRRHYQSEILSIINQGTYTAHDRIKMFSKMQALIQKAGVIKKVYVDNNSKDNAFVRFFLTVFGCKQKPYFLRTEFDEKVWPSGENGWAKGVELFTM